MESPFKDLNGLITLSGLILIFNYPIKQSVTQTVYMFNTVSMVAVSCLPLTPL